MTNNATIIKGTGMICKGNVEGNFEQVPMELFDYIQLRLITHTDLVVYVKLLQLYNHNEGYAFPTIEKLMIDTRIGGKATIHNSLKRLGEVGLIQKSKASWGNNTYVVYKPLSKTELYKCVSDKVEQFKEFESKLMKISVHDKERFQQHLQDKQLREQQEQQVQARQVVPIAEQPVNNESTDTEYNDLLPEEIEMLRKVELLERR
ncbi:MULTISPECIES: helix-turn-helix domain-containing protein [Bacillus cereus group]|uniref:helix-turn-helix domain-containing protein n=1 Tax=Bacillus cereus group TaxID=86661 RepID=UPI001C017F87|nr:MULTISPECIES: helix-turn-helix domain-containing protein [Bacillus cereus group]MDM5463789.1 transcriptional regulator [Bacillus cereus]QWH07776.1 transcriptional regulator [Bacillus mycoides]WJE24433.1 transcriptional regulator [Bacillus cereus]